MKKPTMYQKLILAIPALLLSLMAMAQDKIEIDKQEIGSWFERNWMWVAGAFVLLLLIVLFSRGGSSRRRSTTVVKDEFGNVKSVTTTEIKE